MVWALEGVGHHGDEHEGGDVQIWYVKHPVGEILGS